MYIISLMIFILNLNYILGFRLFSLIIFRIFVNLCSFWRYLYIYILVEIVIFCKFNTSGGIMILRNIFFYWRFFIFNAGLIIICSLSESLIYLVF